MENTRKRVQLVEHKGRGRPQGSLSKIAQEAREKAQATGLLPHEFLLSIARGEIIYRDVMLPNGQIDKIEEVYDFDARSCRAGDQARARDSSRQARAVEGHRKARCGTKSGGAKSR